MHATGLYPEWWNGRRFDSPTHGWVAGDSIEATRDVPQKLLLGDDLDEQLGTGLIPKSLITRITRKQIPDSCDRAFVRHKSGGLSMLGFKSYDQGARKFKGARLHWIWFDEEAPADVYSEGLARVTDTRGLVYLTLTPLEGMTAVVGYFYPTPSTPDRALIQADIDTAGLYTRAEIARKIASYRPHEREARARGIPMLGSGPVYPIAESRICVSVNSFENGLPKGWPGIVGMDFGGDHPTAAVKLLYDKGADCVYVCGEYKVSEEAIVVHARAIKAMGGDRFPVVWPHDGWQQADRAGRSEKSVAELYRAEGVRMWPTHSTFPDGGYGTPAIIDAIYDRMRTNRFKVITELCPMWLAEFRRYHKKDGKIAKEFDDLMSATHKAVMMLRVARPEEIVRPGAGLRSPAPQAGWDVYAGLSKRSWE